MIDGRDYYSRAAVALTLARQASPVMPCDTLVKVLREHFPDERDLRAAIHACERRLYPNDPFFRLIPGDE